MADIDKQMNKIGFATVTIGDKVMPAEEYFKGNNPGNIKVSSDWTGNFYLGKQYYGTDDKPLPKIKYKKFDTKAEGLADIITTIKKYNTNSLNEIINTYTGDDESGETYKNYYKDLTEKWDVPEIIDFNNDEHIGGLMKGITDVENPPASMGYYLLDDYMDALKLLEGK